MMVIFVEIRNKIITIDNSNNKNNRKCNYVIKRKLYEKLRTY